MKLVNSIKRLFKYQQSNNKTSTGHKRDENREIGIITYGFLAIFIGLIVYLGIFVHTKSRDIINNPYNRRQALLEERLIRGDILSKDGKVLASTISLENGGYARVYPYQNVYAQIVGYSTHGVLGIESLENFKMLECDDDVIRKIRNDLTGVKNKGNSVVSTLDSRVQQAAYDAFGNKRGAAFVMNAKTGEIICALSKPDFDPNKINENWEELNSNPDAPLLNRAIMGQYPPGSTFKIVTALEYIKENNGLISEYEYDCNGSFKLKGSEINCYHNQRHGEVDFNLSFAKSCNSSFANIASTLDKSKFEATCNELMFNGDLPFELSYSRGKTDVTNDSTLDELLQTGIGQGRTLVSPAHMTLITAAIANDGIVMQPYIVSDIINASGRVIERTTPKEYKEIMDKRAADILKELMRDVVTDGTGTKANNTKGYVIGGKTGSAEYSKDKSKSHAWFTGYGIKDDECIVATVIVEGGGSGGDVAAPIVKSIFDAYYE